MYIMFEYYRYYPCDHFAGYEQPLRKYDSSQTKILIVILCLILHLMITKIPLENFLIIDIETVSEKKDYHSLAKEW